MKFIFLYGAPAVGKLTVARELASLTGYRLFDNHLVVDAVLALHDFGTPAFVALREALWRASFESIVRHRPEPGVIFTFNAESTVPQKFIDDLFTMFDQAGIDVSCFELTAPEQIIEARLLSEDRRSKRKLTDLQLYHRLRASGVFDKPVIKRNRLVLDTSQQSPKETAARIADRLAGA